MSLVSIDPGIKGLALAVWDPCLIEVRLLPLAKAATFGKRDLWQPGRDYHLGGVDEVVLEKMVHYPGQRGARADAVANDLIDLTAVSCLLAGSLHPREISFLTPQEWKGNVPKEVMQRRIEKALSGPELALLEAACKGVGALAHNLWDAVGIGLKHLGRL
jgi:hypothetical protein